MPHPTMLELRLGSFADGQAEEPPDTAFVGRFSTGQEHPGAEVDQARPASDGHAVRRFLADRG
jgi:hypothetical protein